MADFALQGFEVGDRDALVFLNRNITSAEKAEALAEGNVHVERNRRGSFFRPSAVLLKILRPEIILPHRRRRITRIPRPRPVIFLQRRVRNLPNLWFVDLVFTSARRIHLVRLATM